MATASKLFTKKRHERVHQHLDGTQHAPHTHHDHAAHQAHGPALPLALAGENHRVKVCGVHCNDETARHLENLGFVPGCEVAVVCENNGNLIVDVKGARVALSRQMAGKIMVNEDTRKGID